VEKQRSREAHERKERFKERHDGRSCAFGEMLTVRELH
jgi:hypothetical protein